MSSSNNENDFVTALASTTAPTTGAESIWANVSSNIYVTNADRPHQGGFFV